MEPLNLDLLPTTEGSVACCECGASISPNPTNTCVSCLRAKVNIVDEIPTRSQIYSCRKCCRYLTPPNTWTYAELESPGNGYRLQVAYATHWTC